MGFLQYVRTPFESPIYSLTTVSPHSFPCELHSLGFTFDSSQNSLPPLFPILRTSAAYLLCLSTYNFQTRLISSCPCTIRRVSSLRPPHRLCDTFAHNFRDSPALFELGATDLTITSRFVDLIAHLQQWDWQLSDTVIGN